MRYVWKIINGFTINSKAKNALFLMVLLVISMIIGGAVWGLAARFFLKGMSWLLAFMLNFGIFAGLFGGIVYLYNHEFGEKNEI